LYTDGGARITKDLFVSGTTYLTNLTVYGTASVQYITSSQINVGANIIYLNTQTPAVRYGGMAVADSGSNAGVTGSMLWDSVNNGWIYTRESGSTYSGGALISGPRSSVQGSEQSTIANYIMKGQGGDHITGSQIYDDGTTVQIPGNLQVTGSISGSSALYSSTVTATNGLLIGNGGATATTNYLPKFTGASTIGNSVIQEVSGNILIGNNTSSATTTPIYLSLGGTYGTTLANGIKVKLYESGGVSHGLGVIAGNLYLNTTDALTYITLNTNNTERLRIDTSGNLGLGVTPSAWGSAFKAIQVGGVGSIMSSDDTYFVSSNSYINSSSSRTYITNGYALEQRMSAADGQYQWKIAPSGTAGAAITFTQAMTLTAAGNLGVGVTGPVLKLDVQGNAADTTTVGGVTVEQVSLFRPSNGVGGIRNGFNTTSGDAYIWSAQSSANLYLGTRVSPNNNVNISIFSSGNVAVGTTTDANYKLDVNGTGRFVNNGISTAFGDASSFVLNSIKSTLTASQTVAILIGKANSLNNQMTLLYNHVSDGSSSNFLGLGFYGADNLFKLYPTGAATFSSSVLTNSEYDVNASGGIGGFTGFKLRYGSASVQSLTMGQATAGNGAWIGMAQYRAGGYWQTEGTAAAVLQFESDGTFKINTNSGLTANTDYNVTARLTIASTGAATFSAAGAASYGTINLVSSDSFIRLNTTGGTADKQKWDIRAISATSSEALEFRTINDANNSFSTKMWIAHSGNVGIGTTSPASKLQVVGAAVQTEGLLNVSNTYAAGGVYYPAAKIRNTRGDHSYGIVSEFSIGSVGGTDRSSILFYSDATSHSWQIGQVTAAWGTADSFGIGYRANNSPSTFTGWPTSYFIITTGGDVGIGTSSPGYKLDVTGTIRATADIIAYSDARVKDNVKTIEAPLEIVKGLRGVTYTRNDNEDKSRKVGVIAQEVLSILPEVVQQDDNGNYSVAYGNIVGVLIEAIKEQQLQIEELKTLIHGLTK
jgi:hypothetical protein